MSKPMSFLHQCWIAVGHLANARMFPSKGRFFTRSLPNFSNVHVSPAKKLAFLKLPNENSNTSRAVPCRLSKSHQPWNLGKVAGKLDFLEDKIKVQFREKSLKLILHIRRQHLFTENEILVKTFWIMSKCSL